VERVLEAFEAARGYDWVVLVSGEDYPARPLGEWERWLRSQGVEALNAAAPMPEDDTEGRERSAFRWRVVSLGGPLLPVLWVVRRLARGRWDTRVRIIRPLCFIAYRRAKPPTDVWKGSMWLAMSSPMLEHVLASAGKGRRDFGRSLVPDESCLQTLVATSGLPTLDVEVTFTRWSAGGAAHPDALGPEDFDEVTAAGTAFARKVSGARGAQLCDLLDENVLYSALVPVS
jgi:hypothetical protein